MTIMDDADDKDEGEVYDDDDAADDDGNETVSISVLRLCVK